jgi:biotin carboxyl carrier protein
VTFDVEVAGRIRRVSVQPVGDTHAAGGAFRVRVDDADIEVWGHRTDLGLLLRFADGRTLDVALTPRQAGEWLVQLPHVGVTAVVDGHRAQTGRPGDAATAGAQRITAPMPGRVVRILVKPGDAVAARQGLVVVEAMKMENELSSPRAGTVREVAVTEGAPVESGRLLIVVD